MPKKVKINPGFHFKQGNSEVTVKSQVITASYDPDDLEPLAEGVLEAIQAGIRDITATPSPRTVEQRAEARRAVDRGASWARERFNKRPDPTNIQLFNSSGELVEGLRLVKLGRGKYAIETPENRLHGRAWDSQRVSQQLTRLVNEVPELRKASVLFKRKSVKTGAAKAVKRIVKVDKKLK